MKDVLPDKKTLQRVSFYIDQKEYNLLRSKLMLENTTVSNWLRRRIKSFVKRNELCNG